MDFANLKINLKEFSKKLYLILIRMNECFKSNNDTAFIHIFQYSGFFLTKCIVKNVMFKSLIWKKIGCRKKNEYI